MESKRLSYVNKMMAIRPVACSNHLFTLSRAKIQEEIDMLEIHFAGFIEEHARIVENTEIKDRADQAEHFKNIEAMYQNIRGIFLGRIARLEQKRLLESQRRSQQANRNLEQNVRSPNIN